MDFTVTMWRTGQQKLCDIFGHRFFFLKEKYHKIWPFARYIIQYLVLETRKWATQLWAGMSQGVEGSLGVWVATNKQVRSKRQEAEMVCCGVRMHDVKLTSQVEKCSSRRGTAREQTAAEQKHLARKFYRCTASWGFCVQCEPGVTLFMTR